LQNLQPIARSAKSAMFVGLFSLPLLGGLVYAVWPTLHWHRGSTAPKIEADARPQSAQPQERQIAAAAQAETGPPPQPATISRNLRVTSGDTLMEMLTNAGVQRQEAYEAIAALRDVFSPRKLRPGNEIQLDLSAATPDADSRLLALNLQPDVERFVRVTRSESDGFVAEFIDRPL